MGVGVEREGGAGNVPRVAVIPFRHYEWGACCPWTEGRTRMPKTMLCFVLQLAVARLYNVG